ncbi:MAG TPA: hypothetical protein VGH29_00325 [Candidatus Binataceae bacterium]|jgi:hypothetical protein
MQQAERRNPTTSTGPSNGARRIVAGAVGLLMAMLIADCASFQETPAQKAQRIDPVLSAAGFHMVAPDSPKKQELFGSMPPLTMRYYMAKNGKPRYWFADPYECNCLYEGDEKAYQNYQNLRLQQKLVKEEEQAAELNQDAAMQMNMYDPMFYPY